MIRPQEYQERRKKLLKSIPEGSAVILFAGSLKKSSADASYDFVVNRNFYYLTGIAQENSILMLVKSYGETYELLFVDEKNENKEKWVGIKLSLEEARDISGTTYNFQQGENVRTGAPVSEVPLEYNEVGNMPPNTTFDEDGYIVIRDDHGVILDRINPVYTPTDNGTDITYQDPANGNQIIIHSPYGGTNS